MPGAISTGAPGVVVEELDGSPSGFARKIVLPNGTLALSAGVATYTAASAVAVLGGASTSTGIAGASTGYFHPNGDGQSAGTIDIVTKNWLAPSAGTLRNLRIQQLNALGAGEEITVTVRVAGSNTSLTATIPATSGAGTKAADTSNTAAVAAGDAVQMVIASTDAQTNGGNWSMEFVPS